MLLVQADHTLRDVEEAEWVITEVDIMEDSEVGEAMEAMEASEAASVV